MFFCRSGFPKPIRFPETKLHLPLPAAKIKRFLPPVPAVFPHRLPQKFLDTAYARCYLKQTFCIILPNRRHNRLQ